MLPVCGVSGVVRLGVEVDVLAVHGDFAGDDVVAARVVLVMQTAVALVVAVDRVADRVAVLDVDACPVGEIAVDLDRVQAAQLRDRADALVAADVLGHLHVVVVGVAAFHRLDGSG